LDFKVNRIKIRDLFYAGRTLPVIFHSLAFDHMSCYETVALFLKHALQLCSIMEWW